VYWGCAGVLAALGSLYWGRGKIREVYDFMRFLFNFEDVWKKVFASSGREKSIHGLRRTSLRSGELRLGKQLRLETDKSFKKVSKKGYGQKPYPSLF
jgi:hypothetical protein